MDQNAIINYMVWILLACSTPKPGLTISSLVYQDIYFLVDHVAKAV
jgi:hypothetical protein